MVSFWESVLFGGGIAVDGTVNCVVVIVLGWVSVPSERLNTAFVVVEYLWCLVVVGTCFEVVPGTEEDVTVGEVVVLVRLVEIEGVGVDADNVDMVNDGDKFTGVVSIKVDDCVAEDVLDVTEAAGVEVSLA